MTVAIRHMRRMKTSLEQREYARRWYAANRALGQKRARDWYAAAVASGRRPSLLLSRRRSHFQRKYGLSLEEIDRMVVAQSGMCAICSRPLPIRRAVDHDHQMNRVRGVLCDGCNRHLGWAERYLADVCWYLGIGRVQGWLR